MQHHTFRMLELSAFRYLPLATQRLTTSQSMYLREAFPCKLLPRIISEPSFARRAYERSLIGPLAPFGVPIWKPFFALRAIVLSFRIRPVPVVFLRFAFSLQLSKS